MPLFNGKYRTESTRTPGWDYSRNGYYFITPVVLDFHCNFGIIKNGEMILSEMGKIVDSEWYKSFEIRHELFLDEYILMPNHLHAIRIIKNPENKIGMRTNSNRKPIKKPAISWTKYFGNPIPKK
jgi:hypothetical protein